MSIPLKGTISLLLLLNMGGLLAGTDHGRNDLAKAILAAQNRILYTELGSSEGQFPPAARETLELAIKTAIDSYETLGTSTVQINQVLWTLSDAVMHYESSVQVSTSDLIDELATRETKYLYQNLQELASDHLIYGMHDATGYGVGWSNNNDRSDVRDVCGSYPGMFSWDIMSLTREHDYWGLQYRMELAYRSGGINTLCWHQYDPDGRGFYAENVNGENIVASLLPGNEQHEYYREKLRTLADFLKNLKGSHGESIPVILRPYHEHDGGWFWWGVGQCSTDEYNQIWRFTYHYLTDSLNVHNLIWAISPNNFTTTNSYLARYPGDDYVDVFGMDNYFFGEPISQDAVISFLTKLRVIGGLAQSRHKLCALTEVGYETLPLSTWHTQVLLDPLKRDPLARMVSYAAVWRNAHIGHHYAPYPGHPSVQDFIAFYEDDYTIFASDMPPVYFHDLVEPDYGSVILPTGVELQQNYPNPFNPGTVIPYAVSEPLGAEVSIQIYDLSGTEIIRFQRDHGFAGAYTIQWDGTRRNGQHIPSGMYICQLAALGSQESRKMLYLK